MCLMCVDTRGTIWQLELKQLEHCFFQISNTWNYLFKNHTSTVFKVKHFNVINSVIFNFRLVFSCNFIVTIWYSVAYKITTIKAIICSHVSVRLANIDLKHWRSWDHWHAFLDSIPSKKQKLDFIPACLASLGLMQRTYDGSFDMRISMSFARLALNWVAAWRGRHKQTGQRTKAG